MLEQGAIPLLDLCLEKGIAIIAAGIYNSGILATGTVHDQARYQYRAAPPDVIANVQKLETLCAEFNIPLHTAATQFPLRHPAITAIGGSSMPRCTPTTDPRRILGAYQRNVASISRI